MFWKKTVVLELSASCRKVVLERTNLFGKSRRLKYKEIVFPPENGDASSEYINVTRCRLFWRLRIKHPLKVDFYKRITNDQWEKIGTTVL